MQYNYFLLLYYFWMHLTDCCIVAQELAKCVLFISGGIFTRITVSVWHHMRGTYKPRLSANTRHQWKRTLALSWFTIALLLVGSGVSFVSQAHVLILPRSEWSLFRLQSQSKRKLLYTATPRKVISRKPKLHGWEGCPLVVFRVRWGYMLWH